VLYIVAGNGPLAGRGSASEGCPHLRSDITMLISTSWAWWAWRVASHAVTQQITIISCKMSSSSCSLSGRQCPLEYQQACILVVPKIVRRVISGDRLRIPVVANLSPALIATVAREHGQPCNSESGCKIADAIQYSRCCYFVRNLHMIG
jgi:hypothetical protein